MMDSNQEGEASAAFARVREIMRRQGTNFCGVLECWHEAERKNLALDRQNARLKRENAALRGSDGRPASPAATGGAGGLLSMLDRPAFRYWDIGLIVIIAAWAFLGQISAAAALSQAAVVLICTAFTNWFSLIRLFAGLLLGLAAYGTMPQPQFYAGTAAPATPPAPANATLQPQPGDSMPPVQTSAEPRPQPRSPAVVEPSRRPRGRSAGSTRGLEAALE
jgi:hypothetical protein